MSGNLKKYKNVFSRALNDSLKGREMKAFKSKLEESIYKGASDTLVMGQRLISMQTAFLGLETNATPFQAPEIGTKLYPSAKDLNIAFSNRTPKITRLFQDLRERGRP